MHTTSIKMSRKEPCEKVWSTPIVQLSQTYGILGVGLAKVCRKWKIPVPGRGYWQRLKSGKKVHQDRLPEWSHPWLREPVEFQSVVGTQAEADRDSEMEKLIESERDATNLILVAEGLGDLHPLADRARELLMTASSDDGGILQTGKQTCLDTHVSLDSLWRALLVMDALLKALARRATLTGGCSHALVSCIARETAALGSLQATEAAQPESAPAGATADT